MQRLLSEFVGTTLLLATIVGSGIMADTSAGGNSAIVLLGNTIPTGAMLVVLITILGPISGAHFNPVVTGVFWWRGDIAGREVLLFIAVQIAAAILGIWAAHAMFGQEILQTSLKPRTGTAQWFSEAIATFGLILVILGGIRHKPDAVPVLVGLYITAAYWFTASTSFANPAVTIARSLSNTFAGIAPENVPMFILAQFVGAAVGLATAKVLFTPPST